MVREKILLVDDEAPQRQLLAGFLEGHGYAVTQAENGQAAVELYASVFAPLAVVDMKMPGMSGLELLQRLRAINPFIQVIVLTAFGSVESAVEAMQVGAYDYMTKPVQDLDELLLRLEKAATQNRLVVENQVLSTRLKDYFPDTELIGRSPAIQRVREMIALVAPRDTTVLITGPSGTGKELVARAIHALSPRASKRLVAINCAAFPETLLESELFGYEKGAFTGADRTRQGRFELAEGGTLFLDEVGEMPLTMQVKLLRVLEERSIERLGSVREIKLDIRLLAATNRDVDKMVKDGVIREDLYYRLNVVNVHLPPLAERTGDVLLLAEKFIEKYARKIGKEVLGLDAAAASALTSYSWPGNVRELENIIERAIILTRSNVLGRGDLAGLESSRSTPPATGLRPLSEVEKEHIRFCLDQMDWNIGLTAEKLGIHRNTLRLKIKEYELTRSE
jgi:two-component system response regulator HydG